MFLMIYILSFLVIFVDINTKQPFFIFFSLDLILLDKDLIILANTILIVSLSSVDLISLGINPIVECFL